MIYAVLLSSLALLLALPARAEPPARGVEAFVAEVLERNPALEARALAAAAQREAARVAGLWPDPEASVMLDNVPQQMDGGEMPMLRYQLSQMIPWPGKLGLMASAAERRGDALHADADTRRLDLVRDAKRGYWMLLSNKGLRDVNRAGRGLLDGIVKATLARYGAGTSGHHEVVRAQLEQSAADVEALDLEGERTTTLAMLNALRDRPADAELPDPEAPAIEVMPSAPALPGLMRAALARRPELAQMRAMQREEQLMADLARRERYPDLMTSVWYNQMLGEPDTGGVMVGVTLPLFNVRRQNGLARAADLRAGSAGSESRAMQNMIRFEIADALRRLDTAARTQELLVTSAAPRANQSFVSALAAYSTGSVPLEAWRALQSVERARVEAIMARLVALADLERAVGGSIREVAP